MSEAFDSFFDKVDGARDGRTNSQLEMKELRSALSENCFSREERKLATMLLDEYDLAKSLRDGGGQISRHELSDYIALNKGRFSDKESVFAGTQNEKESRRAYLSNLMDRINYNFSSDNDDNRYLTRDELRTAIRSGRDKNSEALSSTELELIETLNLNWKRDIKNVSERKGEDNDGISVYDLYALAERQPRKFADLSSKINQTYRSALPELSLEQEPRLEPVPRVEPVPAPRLEPGPRIGPYQRIEPGLQIEPGSRIEVTPPKCREDREPFSTLRVPSHDLILIIDRAIRIPGQRIQPYYHREHHHQDHHHQNHHPYYRERHYNMQRDPYDFHGGRPHYRQSARDNYGFHGGR